MTDDASCCLFCYTSSQKGRGVLYYVRQVNGEDYVFIGFVVLWVCVCVCVSVLSGMTSQ